MVVNESVYSKIVQGVKCCEFGMGMYEVGIYEKCKDCPYCGHGCGDTLKMDLLHFLEFFSSVDGWAEALGLKKFVIGGENND